jgi:hypothetical protein
MVEKKEAIRLVRKMIAELDIDNAELSAIINVDERSIRRWQSGSALPSLCYFLALSRLSMQATEKSAA